MCFDRKAALIALGKWGREEVTELAVKFLSDPHRKMRKEAVKQLVNFGEKSRAALEKVNSKKETRIVEELLTSLDIKKRLAAGEKLTKEFFEEIAFKGSHAWDFAIEILKDNCDGKAVSILIDGLKHNQSLASWCAVVLLSGIGEEVRPAVQEFLRTRAINKSHRAAEWVLQRLDSII